MKEQEYTKYEIARMIGARALQLAMGAPMLLNLNKEELNNIKFNPITIARTEFARGILPITIKRPLPFKIIDQAPEE